MITEGYKKPITEQSINYKPYGEIDRTDMKDITKKPNQANSFNCELGQKEFQLTHDFNHGHQGQEEDKASAEHDRKDEGSRWTSSTSTQGNNKWMRRNSSLFIGGGLLPIPTQRMWDKTYSRENQAVVF